MTCEEKKLLNFPQSYVWLGRMNTVSIKYCSQCEILHSTYYTKYYTVNTDFKSNHLNLWIHSLLNKLLNTVGKTKDCGLQVLKKEKFKWDLCLFHLWRPGHLQGSQHHIAKQLLGCLDFIISAQETQLCQGKILPSSLCQLWQSLSVLLTQGKPFLLGELKLQNRMLSAGPALGKCHCSELWEASSVPLHWDCALLLHAVAPLFLVSFWAFWMELQPCALAFFCDSRASFKTPSLFKN